VPSPPLDEILSRVSVSPLTVYLSLPPLLRDERCFVDDEDDSFRRPLEPLFILMFSSVVALFPSLIIRASL
jgi:hypothetical protein